MASPLAQYAARQVLAARPQIPASLAALLPGLRKPRPGEFSPENMAKAKTCANWSRFMGDPPAYCQVENWDPVSAAGDPWLVNRYDRAKGHLDWIRDHPEEFPQDPRLADLVPLPDPDVSGGTSWATHQVPGYPVIGPDDEDLNQNYNMSLPYGRRPQNWWQPPIPQYYIKPDSPSAQTSSGYRFPRSQARGMDVPLQMGDLVPINKPRFPMMKNTDVIGTYR